MILLIMGFAPVTAIFCTMILQVLYKDFTSIWKSSQILQDMY